MAYTSKLTKDNRAIFKQLFELGLPFRVIGEAMEVNPATVQKYLKKVEANDSEMVKGRPATQLRMLEIYSSSVGDPLEFAKITKGVKKDLQKILWKELDFDSLIVYFMAVLDSFEYVCAPTYEENITESEQKFFNEVFFKYYRPEKSSLAQAKRLVEEHMMALHEGVAIFPSEELFNHRMECFKVFAIDLVQSRKKFGAPYITPDIRDFIKSVILNEGIINEREFAIVQRVFSLGWKQDDDSLGLELTSEGVRLVKNKAIIKLRTHRLLNNLLVDLDWNSTSLLLAKQALISSTQTLQDSLSANRLLMVTNSQLRNENIILRSKVGSGEEGFFQIGDVIDLLETESLGGFPLKALLTPIEECGFNARAFTALKTISCNFLWELAEFTSSDLLKFRNLGKKTLVEIEAIVKERGLRFGIVFTGDDRERLRKMCFKK